MDNFSSRHAIGVAMCCTILTACSGQSPGTISGTAAAQSAAPVVVTRASATESGPVMRYAGGEVRETSAYKTLAPSAQSGPAKAPAPEIVIDRELGTASDGGYMAY